MTDSETALDLLVDCWITMPDGELRTRVEQFIRGQQPQESAPRVLLCGACTNGRPDDCSGWCGVMSGKVSLHGG